MPKIVDQNERRQIVAEAVWTIIARSGLKGATIRTVADECGMSVGSIQHYFGSQNDLYYFSMELMVERATERINFLGTHDPRSDAEALESIIDMLEQLLPLDQDRRTEAQTWLVFSAEAISNEELQELQIRMNQLIKSACKNCLVYLEGRGVLIDKIDIDYETERLYALLDGLTLHLIIDCEQAAGKRAQKVLHNHVYSLTSLTF